MSLISFTLDDSGFTAMLERLESRLPAELAAAALDLGEEGERLVKQALVQLIYETPERGYTRSEELLRSAYGYHEMTGEGFAVIVGAVGGADSRKYAAANETGTYSSRIDRDRILNDARAANDFAPKAYPRAGKGLEARPFSDPAIAEIERRAGDRVLQAISKALG